MCHAVLWGKTVRTTPCCLFVPYTQTVVVKGPKELPNALELPKLEVDPKDPNDEPVPEPKLLFDAFPKLLPPKEEPPPPKDVPLNDVPDPKEEDDALPKADELLFPPKLVPPNEDDVVPKLVPPNDMVPELDGTHVLCS